MLEGNYKMEKKVGMTVATFLTVMITPTIYKAYYKMVRNKSIKFAVTLDDLLNMRMNEEADYFEE